MTRLDFSGLSAAAGVYDAHVEQSPAIDRFCSSSAWVLPARAAFAPDAEPLISQSAAGFVSLCVLSLYDGRRVALPLESGWGLASPFAGANVDALARQFAQMCRWPNAPDGLYLSGLKRDGPQFQAILNALGGRARFGLGQDCERRVCGIADGLDAWLATRSPKFRANLRRAQRKAAAAGYTWRWITDPSDVSGLFERIMAVESQSWKGQTGVGVDDGAAREFYRRMVPRLARTGRLRVLLGQQDGVDVAYVLGGVFGDTFRGLQLSYVAEHRRFELGNVAQIETIAALCAEGVARYDLGTEMPYKARWAPPGLTTVTLAVFLNR